jgi:LPXTG-motif cell wall-anchored protein
MTTTRKSNKKHLTLLSSVAAIAVVGVALLIPTITSASGPTVNQGTTTTYGVLAATTITNTGATTISGSAGGDVGLSPGTSYTGSGSVTRSGVDHITDGAAAIAQTDLATAYGDLLTPTPTTLAAPDLAGQTITPGTYSTAAGTFSNSGNLTLDAGGDSSAKFIFQAASTVITGSGSTMTLTGGAQACNVFWQVGSSATVGTSSTFVGHIYALTSITANSGATIYGQLLARNGAVTLDNNTIVNNNCTAAATATQSSIPAPPQDSKITSITTSECTTVNDYTVHVLGDFPSAITNVAVNAQIISASRWSQTPFQVELTIPASAAKTFTVDLYNGKVPLLPTQVFICTTPVVEASASPTPTPAASESASPTPVATESVVETATETGGQLPKTSTNVYTYLALGGALVLLGGGGLVLRRRLQK